MFCKEGILKYLLKLTGKHPYWGLFLYNFIEERHDYNKHVFRNLVRMVLPETTT